MIGRKRLDSKLPPTSGTNTLPRPQIRGIVSSAKGKSIRPNASGRYIIIIIIMQYRLGELGPLLLPCWAHCCSMRGRCDRPIFCSHQFLHAFVRFSATHLGFTRCVSVKTVPSRMQRPPTTTYAMPRKGFLPPMIVRVEMRIDLVPPYFSAGKSG